jgi:ATP-binding cassette subfamily B protein
MKNKNLFKRFFKYIKPYKSSLLLVFVAVLFTSSSVLGLGQALKYLVNEGFKENSFYFLNRALVLLLGIVVFLTIAIYLRASLIHSICEKMIHQIRVDLFSKSLSLAPAYFEINKTSDIIAKITNDTTLLSGIIINIFSFAIRNFLMLIGSIILLITTSPILSLYISFIIPLITMPIIILGKKVRLLSKASQDQAAILGSEVQENLNNIKIIQSYNQEEFQLQKFYNTSIKALETARQRIKVRSLLVSLVILLVFSAIVFILWLGGKSVIKGTMSIGDLSSFIFYSVIAASSFGSVTEIITDFQRALGAIDRIFELLDATSPLSIRSSTQFIDTNNSITINFQNVNFAYPSRPKVLVGDNLNFKIFSNEKVAIVGPSGAGKTTIFQLLLRFYDINSGNIIINDTSIENIDLKHLRNIFCYVPQEPIIFSANAYENIAFSMDNISKEEIYYAAKVANIYDYLSNLPGGFNSFLGERGIRLSGGERQRISLARAALRKPKVLLLDEATSSLDNENERLIQNSLDQLMQNKTTLIIAHRLSTIINSNRIIVINNGKIENIGSHTDLLDTSPLYQKLINNIKIKDV